MTIEERFDTGTLDTRLHWYHEPGAWHLTDARLVLWPDGQTDFWQKTHYGFTVDTGHFLYAEVAGDFSMTTRVRFQPAHRYDQAGLMVRLSPTCWLKTAVEYEPDGPAKLGAVVTNHGYSDWSTQDYPRGRNELALRIRRAGSDYLVEYRDDEPAEHAGGGWTQIRLAHLMDDAEGRPVACGLYACSPTAAGYVAEFAYLTVLPGRL